jgi:hypothetical protein
MPWVLGSPSVRQKINFLVVAWKDVFFAFSAAWLVLAVAPSHGRSFGIKTLAGLSCQVFEE